MCALCLSSTYKPWSLHLPSHSPVVPGVSLYLEVFGAVTPYSLSLAAALSLLPAIDSASPVLRSVYPGPPHILLVAVGIGRPRLEDSAVQLVPDLFPVTKVVISATKGLKGRGRSAKGRERGEVKARAEVLREKSKD